MSTANPPATLPAGRAVGRGVLLRYRVMAFTTAVLLIVLVFVGIPLQAVAFPQVVNVVGTLHGFLYIVYLVAAFQLTRRLRVPRWKMLLVLLAGTVPFCAFVAERKMTRRFEELVGPPTDGPARAPAAAWRRRWLSRRALLFHLEVAVVAPGCAVAGWWQATRALAGNSLSWVYSVEWPIFALLALGGWWHLVHEDPHAYGVRQARQARERQEAAQRTTELIAAASVEAERSGAVDAFFARRATRLAAGVGVELLLGIMGVASIPFSRPSGWTAPRGEAVYAVHALVGLALVPGAILLVVHTRGRGRVPRVVAWMGLVGVLLAGLGGLLTEPQSLVRFLGVTLMGIGTATAGFAYLIPFLLRRRPSAVTGRVDPRVAPAVSHRPAGRDADEPIRQLDEDV